MPKRLFVFTLNGCPQCNELKDRLKSENIEYTEVEITEHKDIWDIIVEGTKQDYVPTIFFQSNDSGDVFTPMNDYGNLDDLIKIIHENIEVK